MARSRAPATLYTLRALGLEVSKKPWIPGGKCISFPELMTVVRRRRIRALMRRISGTVAAADMAVWMQLDAERIADLVSDKELASLMLLTSAAHRDKAREGARCTKTTTS